MRFRQLWCATGAIQVDNLNLNSAGAGALESVADARTIQCYETFDLVSKRRHDREQVVHTRVPIISLATIETA
jgi:hypothetical protein